MNTVRIDGFDYPYFGMTDDRRGIITEDRTFWMFPDCYPDGSPVTELPRIGPCEIKAVSFDEPDLTETYLDEVKADHERYLNYWRTVTPEDHAKEYGLFPGRERDEEEAAHTERVKQWLEGFRPQFEDGRKRLLAVPFDDYRRDTGKQNAWIRHGSPELAEKYGFREHMNLYLGMYGQKVDREALIPRIIGLHYEVCYADPDGTAIYLRTVVPDRHTPDVLRHVLAYKDLLNKTPSTQPSAPVQSPVARQQSTPEAACRENHITYEGSTFRIRFHGETFAADDDGGMRFLAGFLLHPRGNPKARDLYNQVKGLPEDERVSGEVNEGFVGLGERGHGKTCDKAAHEKNAANAQRDIQRMESMTCRSPSEDVELRDLLEYRDAELQKAERGLPDIADPEMTKRGTIKRAIYRTLESMEKKPLEGSKARARDGFIRHVKDCLLANVMTSFSYEPEPDVVWQ